MYASLFLNSIAKFGSKKWLLNTFEVIYVHVFQRPLTDFL